MAIFRDDPYNCYDYLVNLGISDPESVSAGFSEILLPDVAVDVIEYRIGNERTSGVRKLPGRVHYGNVTLRRGVIGALDLYQWMDQTRNGDQAFFREVTIVLRDENRRAVLTWIFHRAWPVRYSLSPLQAKGRDVLLESLELAFDRMDME